MQGGMQDGMQGGRLVNWRRFPIWVVLGVVLIAALLVGSGIFSSKPLTQAQRVEVIAAGIRCPSCEDLSVAQSDAQTAQTVRAAIKAQVARGRTDQQIDNYLVARYGSTIVLSPPTSGWSVLVWILPPLAGAVAVGALVLSFVRRRRRFSSGDGGLDVSRSVTDGDSMDALADQRLFVERSLADAEAEHGVGDLSDEDYETLSQRDRSRLAVIDTRIAALSSTLPATASRGERVDLGDAPVGVASNAHDVADGTAPIRTGHSPRRPRSRRQRFLIGGAIAAFAAAAVVGVVSVLATRLPGQTVTGTVTLSAQQKIVQTLDQASVYENEGQDSQAAKLYSSILSQNPRQAQALEQLGWLDYEVGADGKSTTLMNQGRAQLEEAVKLAPHDFAGHLYLGTIILLQDHDAAGAVVQYNQFLGADPAPPTATVKQAATYLRQAYQEAGVPLPAQVPTS